MTAFATIECWDDIPRAIAAFQAAGFHHRVPFLQALYRGEIAHLELQRGGSHGLFKRWTAMVTLPAVALIGDDDGAARCGPDAWPLAPRALRWARTVVVHGTGPEVAHYEAAVVAAQLRRRLLFIECGTATLDAWLVSIIRWAPEAAVFVMRAPPGQMHPAPGRARGDALRMPATLSAADRDKLAKMLGMLGSAHPGERDAAALASSRFLRARGVAWAQALRPPAVEKPLPELGTWRNTVSRCMELPGLLRPWEAGFLRDLTGFSRLSVKQRYVLKEIAGRVLGGQRP